MPARVFITVFIVLSVLGLVNAGYLNWKHFQKKKQPLVCPLNHDCGAVTESRWSKVFGLRNEVLGVLFFLGMLLGGVLLTTREMLWGFSLPILLLVGTSIGLLFSLFLVFIQARMLKDYCFYCMISALITLMLFVDSVMVWLGA